MSKFFRMLLAVAIGFVLGSVVNMALITVGGKVIPPPAGADITTMDGLKASLHLFEARHFIFPFLAHALGTLVGALVACWLAPGQVTRFDLHRRRLVPPGRHSKHVYAASTCMVHSH